MIYCFDLDGTLCSQRKLDYENAEPYKDRISFVNDLYNEGHEIIIETARGSGSTKGKNWDGVTKNQLDSWGLKYHKIRTGVKHSADFYIDDRAIHSDHFFTEADNK